MTLVFAIIWTLLALAMVGKLGSIARAVSETSRGLNEIRREMGRIGDRLGYLAARNRES